MKLWDILYTAQYFQQFTIYVMNAYDQNVLIGRGTRAEMLAEEREEGDNTLFNNLQNEVEYFHTKGSKLIVFVRDANYDKPLEEQYLERQVARWDYKDPKKRPFLYGIETEEYQDD